MAPHILGGEDVVCPKCQCNLLVAIRVVQARDNKIENRMELKDAFPMLRCLKCGAIAWMPMEVVEEKKEEDNGQKQDS